MHDCVAYGELLKAAVPLRSRTKGDKQEAYPTIFLSEPGAAFSDLTATKPRIKEQSKTNCGPEKIKSKNRKGFSSKTLC